MILKILKEYIRRISRNYKIYAISILGMSIAVIASFHIYHFVYKELSVDGFHTKRKDVYRVLNANATSTNRTLLTIPALGEYLYEKVPEVKEYCQIMSGSTSIYNNDVKTEEPIIHTDSSFFKLFDFQILLGDIKSFQNKTNGIVISNRKSKILFGDQSPIGKSLMVSKRGSEKKAYEVVAVITDFPETSTLQPDFIFNKDELAFLKSEDVKWTVGIISLYIYAPDIDDINEFNRKITDTYFERNNQSPGTEYDINSFKEKTIKRSNWLEAQRLDKIYFNSEDVLNQKRKGSIQYLQALIIVGFLALVLAVFNFIVMNLGLNLNRMKEFHTKRFLGGSKTVILGQLSLESVCNTLICFLLTLVTFPILIKPLKQITGFDYELHPKTDLWLLLIFFIAMVVLGILVGALQYVFSYRAIFKSTKNKIFAKPQKVMVAAQLMLFIGVLSCFLFLQKQLHYIQTQDYGYHKDQVAILNAYGFDEVVINELKSKSYIKNVALGEMLFRHSINLQPIKILKKQDSLNAMVIIGDANYLDTYGMELIEGKNLNSNNKLKYSGHISFGVAFKKNEHPVEVLVNQKFVKDANLNFPIGTMIEGTNFNKAIIVGVFKDVYNTPFYNPIQPIILGHGFNNMLQTSVLASYDKSRKKELKSFLKHLYVKKGMPNIESLKDYFFHLNLNNIYKKEFQLKRLLEAFTIIVLFIALLGLIAISLFITESKTKEIGIRKVNGATIKEIMLMLNKDFIKWVFLAFIIACPIAYYAMSKWLENFAYKTTLSWWVFALAGAFTLIIALLTVSWQTYRAATQNPVESLRDE